LEDWRRVLNSKVKNIIIAFISILINIALACGVIWAVSRSGVLIKGSDSMYHVYRGDWILNSIESGDIWPLYNPVWYNGVELMRGVNIGGLGTLVASLASLISFKAYMQAPGAKAGRYIAWFSGINIAFLLVIYGCSFVI
jgi:hypothetical protein